MTPEDVEKQNPPAQKQEKGKAMITKITMQGFKSFNKRVSVPLMKGFNVVCGPNGVGKSNIIDAICFVLGRTSAKSMRAGRLHELIFHGGDGKAAAKQAIVTLYLDNTNRVFEFDDNEVTITRKVNKKGVSVYKLNGRTTTRQKVLEILGGARIYPDGHNIVMQGDITHIIEMNPTQRRGIIDEISGIAEYNDKKEKAEKNFASVDQKLREAEIIITERYERFKRLEQERNAAIRYRDLGKKLLLLRASLANKKASTYKEEIKQIEEKAEKRREESKRIDERISKIEDDLDEREENMRDIADKLIDMSKRMGEEKKISDVRSNILIAKNSLDSTKREIENLNALIDNLQAFESRTSELSGALPRAVQTILRLKIRGVHGAIRDLIKVSEDYKVGIEIAGGRHLNNIVVENEDVAKYCIDYLKRERIGRVTFLPLNKIKPRFFRNDNMLNNKGVIGVASRIIKYDTKYMRAMEFVFGNTLIVDNFDTAKLLGIGKQRIVTLEGDLMESTGAVTGGHYMRTHPKSMAKSSVNEIEKHRQTKKALEKEQMRLEAELETLGKQLKKLGGTEEVKESIDIEKLRVSSERELDELKTKRKRSYERKLKVQTEINKLDIEKANFEADLKNAHVEVSQYGEMEYVDDTVPTLQRFLRTTQDELNAIGLVNMKAIEEYDMFKSNFNEYKEKYEKILEEKKAIIDMIEIIETKRMGVFYDCLKIVSHHFTNIFKKMTNGNASLELEDPSNLESGLMIKATPHGKKLLSIDSMSGGEKTLTALAFLFSIQKYKPAPFYVLDEVDAALDKENSQTIAELIKLLSIDEQFIMITHNDQTIKYGDRVYGMTMDRGESKILGIELPSA